MYTPRVPMLTTQWTKMSPDPETRAREVSRLLGEWVSVRMAGNRGLDAWLVAVAEAPLGYRNAKWGVSYLLILKLSGKAVARAVDVMDVQAVWTGTARERRVNAQKGAVRSWERTGDAAARTAPARAALEARFLADAGGDPELAERLRQAHYRRMGQKSAQARRAAKERKARSPQDHS